MRYSLKQEKNGFLSDIYQQKQKSKIENKLNKKKNIHGYIYRDVESSCVHFKKLIYKNAYEIATDNLPTVSCTNACALHDELLSQNITLLQH